MSVFSRLRRISFVWLAAICLAAVAATGTAGGSTPPAASAPTPPASAPTPAASAPAPAASVPTPAASAPTPAASAPTPPASPSTPAQVQIDSNTFGALEARAIGPAVMSGRVAAIDAVAVDPLTIWVGAASGGVWKSEDGGLSFEAVFDDYTQSIGAVAVDPADPDTVWVGTGESWTRNSTSVGTGVYKSDDDGETWKFVGLGDSERIARIRIDPAGGDTVFVCATGHLWNANEERGVYKTTDGGETFNRVLYVDENTGCADLAIDPQESRILYAGMWEFRRQPDFFNSGGPGSGLYKSTDGGETWRELTAGLPEGDKGRIGIGVAPSRPSVVYAVVEAEETALYRSDDLGESWTKVNASGTVSGRPFYFAQVVVDPTDFNRVYKPGYFLGMSSDGGVSFSNPLIQGAGYHGDLHALWINPANPHELILGTDGGVYMSYNRGVSWRHVRALPISQFYEASFDMEWPYNVYGGLQDNGTWMAPSRGVAGIQNRDWTNIGMGDGFHAFVDPNDPGIVYVEYQGGNILLFHKNTGEVKRVRPYPDEGEAKLRFNWNTAMHMSPTRPGTLYVGSQYLFRSRDRGDSWERISPDLTTDDPEKQRQSESGGLTIDNSTAENHTTIYTISESPLNGEVIWVGTDDGNLQVTRDGGATWTNVVAYVPGLPANTWVSHVEAGHHDDSTAYVTFDGHRTGDMKTYVYATRDFGDSWTALVRSADDEADLMGYAHVIREDLQNPDLLFLGTEFGLFVSIDRGRQWTRFEGNVPKVAVRDLAIHPRDHDLVIATHGRGIYILDDVTPLRHLTQEVVDSDVAFLPSRQATMVAPAFIQEFPGNDEFVGASPLEAAQIVYYLKKRHLFGDFKIEVYDSAGELVSTVPASKRRGINRADWPMRLRPPKVPPATSLVPQPFAMQGPRVREGTYVVKIIKGDEVYEGEVTLAPDPRDTSSPEDRTLQDETVTRLYGMVESLAFMVDSLIDLTEQANERGEGLDEGDRLARRLREYVDRLEEFRATLVSTSEAGSLSGEEQLRERLVDLYGAVNGYEGRPTDSQLRHSERLVDELVRAQSQFAELTGEPLSELNDRLQREGKAPIGVMSRDDSEQQ